MTFNLSKPDRTIRAGVLLMGGVTELLDVAPIDLLHGMSKSTLSTTRLPLPDSLKSQGLDMEFHWVSESGKPSRLTAGGSIETTSFVNCPSLDIVLMGAHKADYTPNATELAFVRKAHEQCSAMLLICGGFMAANAAGLLRGKTATAPRVFLESVRKDSPETNWVDRRWARDGKIWTSGTLLNGLDLMMAFLREVWGEEKSVLEPLLDIWGVPVRSAEYAPGEGLPI